MYKYILFIISLAFPLACFSDRIYKPDVDRLCGVNSLYVVSALLERKVDYIDAVIDLYNEDIGGVEFSEILLYAKRKGFACEAYLLSVNDLLQLGSGVIAIFYQDAPEGMGHFYVMRVGEGGALSVYNAPNPPSVINEDDIDYEELFMAIVFRDGINVLLK